MPEECSPCTHIELCKGGCRVSAEAHTGQLKGLEPYFIAPIKRPPPKRDPPKLDFNKLKIVHGKVRSRDESNGLSTIYISSKSNAVVTKTELEIFKRFMSGKTYREVLQEVKNKEVLDEICGRLASKNMLVQ